jgi:hypothetical protein
MNTYAEKTQENKSQAAANAVSQKRSVGEFAFQFVDNRPEAVERQKLQEMANKAQSAKQEAQLQAMPDYYISRRQESIHKEDMNTYAKKTHENRSQSAANVVSQKRSVGEFAFQFVDNRPEAIRQRKLQQMPNDSQQAKQVAQLRATPDHYILQRQEPIQKKDQNAILSTHKPTGKMSSEAPVQLKGKAWKKRREAQLAKEAEEREIRKARLIGSEESHHQADLARFKALDEAKEKGPIIDIKPDSDGGSATLSHLNTPYVDKYMRPRSRLEHGAKTRFLTPTKPVLDNEESKTRQISPKQVEKYTSITRQAITNEKATQGSDYAFYHAQDPRMRIAQDVYKRVYARHHGKVLQEDFHFLRFPGPKDDEFRKHKNVRTYFEEDMAEHGMIDDNINPTKTHLISVNPALHGGLGHAGEETFHYFQIGQGQTELPVAAIMGDFLGKFGLDASGSGELYKKAAALNATNEGSLFQIMVPKKQVDDVAYMAHPHGLPHDDELFDDLHEMGEIRYPDRKDAVKQRGLPPREKMNDEVTRNLLNMRKAHQSPKVVRPDPLTPLPEDPAARKAVIEQRTQQARTAFLQQKTRELNHRTVKRFQEGAYRPSKHLEDFIHNPGKLQHPEGYAQKLRMEMNPEHFGGEGVRSPHELMRIQNRSTFMQARLHFSEHTTLNPESGIRIKRFTTMEPDQEQAYNQMLNKYVEQLFANNND